jgi:hypothetical protein
MEASSECKGGHERDLEGVTVGRWQGNLGQESREVLETVISPRAEAREAQTRA